LVEDRIQYFESAEALDSLGAGAQGDWAAELENDSHAFCCASPAHSCSDS
jgi:hypothetical protein